MQQTHIECKDSRCRICLSDSFKLEEELISLTGIDSIDHLGKFHKWLHDQGINPETEYGWGSAAYFDDENIAAYVATWIE